MTKDMLDRRTDIRLYLESHTKERLEVFSKGPQQGRVIFLGDSITEHFDTDLYFNQAINRGISADTTKGLLERLDEIKMLKAPSIVLLIGTNDLGNEYMPVDEILENYTLIIDQLKDFDLFIQEVLPINDSFDLVQTNSQINQINQGLHRLSLTKDVTIIKTRQALEEKGQLHLRYTDDGLHLNNLGYDTLARAIHDLLDLQ